MSSPAYAVDTDRFARCIQASKQVRWDIEADVIRGRPLDTSQKFLPDGLSHVPALTFLTPEEQRYVSQIQGRTYANMFGLVERFVNAKVLELSREHWLGDQVALEALIRFSDEELKHQALFRRIEHLAGAQMPAGYTFVPQPNDVARAVLSKSTWAVLALILDLSCSPSCITGKASPRIPSSQTCSKTCFGFIGKRRASTPFWMSWNGSATTPRSPLCSATRLSRNLLSWWAPSTASSRPKPRPMLPMVPPPVDAPWVKPHGRHCTLGSSKRTGGNIFCPARSIRTSSRSWGASSRPCRDNVFTLPSRPCSRRVPPGMVSWSATLVPSACRSPGPRGGVSEEHSADGPARSAAPGAR